MNLKTELMEHQKKAFNKIKDIKVGALFMEMGTGKTRTALELINCRLVQGKIKKVFWICPVNTKINLKEDIKKHSKFTVEFIENYKNQDICICGTESISQSDIIYLKLNKTIEENKENMLIVDESHFIKNHKSIRSERILKLGLKSNYKLIMTGTPITQGIQDLYCQFYFLHSKILGYNSFHSFANNHLEHSEKFRGMIEKTHNTQYIASKINPYIYQITKKECLDLPLKSYTTVNFSYKEELLNVYEELKEVMLSEINEENFNSYTIFKIIGYLHRVSSGYFKRKVKNYFLKEMGYLNGEINYNIINYDRVLAMIKEIEKIDTKNNKLIIWYKYNSDAELIKNKLNLPHLIYNGNLTEKAKENIIYKFKNTETNILIININSGSIGLNLQEANYMIYYNGTFDYAKRIQSEDRIYRIGQNKNCHIIDIVANLGIDEKIINCIKKKQSLSKEIKKEIEKVKNDKDKIKIFKDNFFKVL